LQIAAQCQALQRRKYFGTGFIRASGLWEFRVCISIHGSWTFIARRQELNMHLKLLFSLQLLDETLTCGPAGKMDLDEIAAVGF